MIKKFNLMHNADSKKKTIWIAYEWIDNLKLSK